MRSVSSSSSTCNSVALVLIERKGDRPRVDSLAVASELGVKHKNVLGLVRKYMERFEGHDRGKVAFETRASAKGQGEVSALLTERHCNFLLTLVRNTDRSVELKDKLERMFNVYRQQAERRASLTWQQVREQGKATRKQAMGQVARIAAIAESEGSKNARHLFENFSKLTNSKLGIEPGGKGATRDKLDADILQMIEQIELVQAGTIIKAISAGVPRREVYPLVKAEVEALNVVQLQPVERPKELAPDDGQMSLFGEEASA